MSKIQDKSSKMCSIQLKGLNNYFSGHFHLPFKVRYNMDHNWLKYKICEFEVDKIKTVLRSILTQPNLNLTQPQLELEFGPPHPPNHQPMKLCVFVVVEP